MLKNIGGDSPEYSIFRSDSSVKHSDKQEKTGSSLISKIKSSLNSKKVLSSSSENLIPNSSTASHKVEESTKPHSLIKLASSKALLFNEPVLFSEELLDILRQIKEIRNDIGFYRENIEDLTRVQFDAVNYMTNPESSVISCTEQIKDFENKIEMASRILEKLIQEREVIEPGIMTPREPSHEQIRSPRSPHEIDESKSK